MLQLPCVGIRERSGQGTTSQRNDMTSARLAGGLGRLAIAEGHVVPGQCRRAYRVASRGPPGGTNARTNGTVGCLRHSKKADAHHAKPPDLVAVGLVLLLLLNQVFAVWVSDPEAVPNSAGDAQWLPSPL